VDTGADANPTHKGTGFVQYKDNKVADEVLALSDSIEQKLDDECRQNRLKKVKKSDSKGVLSVIQAELELNGRRLVIKEAVSKS
jgi:hypothetical protein